MNNMPKIYTDKFLISELKRFYNENGRVPIQSDMTSESGYPSFMAYVRYFDGWNKALTIAGFEINVTQEKRTGFETCCKCGNYLKQGSNWITKGLIKGEVMCINCYANINTDYMNGNLDKESVAAKATISQRIVANVFNLEMKYDCNCTYGFKHPVDLYHKEKYNYINVKDSALRCYKNKSSNWTFDLTQKELPDTYIMLGYDEDRKNILHVWITDAIDDLVFNDKIMKYKKSLTITNIPNSLKEAEPWEIDAKPYNDMLHRMSEKRKETKGKECFLSNDDLR